MGFRVQGSGFRVQGSGFMIRGLGFTAYSIQCRLPHSPRAEVSHKLIIIRVIKISAKLRRIGISPSRCLLTVKFMHDIS